MQSSPAKLSHIKAGQSPASPPPLSTSSTSLRARRQQPRARACQDFPVSALSRWPTVTWRSDFMGPSVGDAASVTNCARLPPAARLPLDRDHGTDGWGPAEDCKRRLSRCGKGVCECVCGGMGWVSGEERSNEVPREEAEEGWDQQQIGYVLKPRPNKKCTSAEMTCGLTIQESWREQKVPAEVFRCKLGQPPLFLDYKLTRRN